MKLKEKIYYYIDNDPMGPLLIPMGMLSIAMIFLFLLFGGTYLYDTWYDNKYVTEVSRSEPAEGIIIDYGTRTEHGYKTIYEDRRMWNGKVWVTKRVAAGSEPYDIIHHYIRFKFYDNLIDDYRVSDWYEINGKMSSGHKFYTWQAITYYDSNKDKTWTELKRYVDN